jgi:putative ABC transport system permease protein
MNLMQIAFSNLIRRRSKAMLMVIGIMVGVATMVSFIQIVEAMRLDLGDRIDEFGANAIVIPDKVSQLITSDIEAIRASEIGIYVNIISPKLIDVVKIDDQDVLIAGIEVNSEFTQKPWLTIDGADLSMIEMADDEIIMGASTADNFQIAKGDTVTIMDKNFRVYGILDPVGSEEDGLIFAPLHSLQSLLGRGDDISMFELSAYCNACPIEEVAMGVETALPGTRAIPLSQAATYRDQSIGEFELFGITLSLVVLMISVLVVLTTMLTSIQERVNEIGIFRAIGFKKRHIITIFGVEIMVISLMGGILGVGIGVLMAKVLGPYLADVQIVEAFSLKLGIQAIMIATGIGLFGSIYPVIKASKLDPIEAFRK